MKSFLNFFKSTFFSIIAQFIVYFPFIIITEWLNLGWIPFIILGLIYYLISNVFFPLIGAFLDIALWIFGVFLLKEAGGILFIIYIISFVLYLLILIAQLFTKE